MPTERVKIVQLPVSAEGTVNLPSGAVVVSIDFEDEGGLGAERRPAAAWVAVPDV